MVSTEVLKEFVFFKELDESQLVKLANVCHERTVDKGALCFHQEDKATELHLCCSGKVDIIVQVKLPGPWSVETIVHTAKAGEVFGWSALVKPYVYTASAKCVEKVKEIYIKGSDLVNLFEDDPYFGYVIMSNLSAVTSSRLIETRQKLCVEIATSLRKDW